MTHAPTNVRPQPVAGVSSGEVTAIDTGARWPLLLLLWAGLKWLLVAGVLALIASIQLHTPSFLAGCSWLTHGRAVALAETAFVYGWTANAGLGLALWVLGRLGGAPLRALNWAVAGTFAWNLGVAIGCVGIAIGDGTSFPLLHLPRYIQPLLLAGYGAIAVSGVLAWSGRRTAGTYASQWYAVAALFLFPWLFTAAQTMLLWAPVRGVLQAVVGGWFAQGVWTLWLAPLALAGAYYVVPRITGRVLPSYGFASLGFWTLIFVGGLTGGRHLIGGPVPAWIPTVATAACIMVLFHQMMVTLNLRGAFAGGGTALRFLAFGIAAYVLAGLIDALTSLRSVAEVTQFTHFVTAQQHLALYGAVSMMFFGVLYFALPRLTGRPWASGALVKGHFGAVVLGVPLLIACLAVAGWIQGSGMGDPSVTFAELANRTRPWLLGATAALGLLLAGNMLLVVNFARSVRAVCCCSAEAAPADPFRAPAAMEAPAS